MLKIDNVSAAVTFTSFCTRYHFAELHHHRSLDRVFVLEDDLIRHSNLALGAMPPCAGLKYTFRSFHPSALVCAQLCINLGMSRDEGKTKPVWSHSCSAQAPIDLMRPIEQLEVQPILDIDSTNTTYIQWAVLANSIDVWGNDWHRIKETLEASGMVQHAVGRAEQEVKRLRSRLNREGWKDERLVEEVRWVVSPCKKCLGQSSKEQRHERF